MWRLASGGGDAVVPDLEIEGGGQQGLRVGLARALEDLARGTFLDDLAVLHHQHMIGQGADHAQVVADEHVGEVALVLQLAQEVDDLGLDAHVERAGWLVKHDELGLEYHGAGDGDALALSA